MFLCFKLILGALLFMPRPRPLRYFQCIKYKNAYHYGRPLEQIRLFLSGWRKELPLPFTTLPPVTSITNRTLSQDQVSFIDQEISDLLHEEVPHYVSPLQAVPKAAGSDRKWRLIIDLRVLNSFLDPPKFSNESIKVIESLCRTK